jgi:hypothetical protein
MTDRPSRPAAAWLRARVPGAPPALLAAMLDALGPEDDGLPLPDALAAAAVRLYAHVRDGSGGREDALPLLAADALLTHALQAQAEADPAAVAAFARRWGGAGELGRLVAG